MLERRSKQIQRLEYDAEADALYIYLRHFDKAASTKARIDISRVIDYDEQGEPLGVEFWNVSSGLNLDDVPERETVTRLLEEYHFEVFA
jgi:uncharacterized protein YuzE